MRLQSTRRPVWSPSCGTPASASAKRRGSAKGADLARRHRRVSVDGKELSRQTVEHTIPFLMAIDESFDIGIDTRTGVNDSYELPFPFTGNIDTLTYKLGPEQLGEK